MSSVFKFFICLQQIFCCFILLKVTFPCEVSVSKPPWPTKVFVPLQSSSVTLICNVNLTNPTFEISGNFGSRLRFTNPPEEMMLNSHGPGLFNEELPGMLAVKLTINDTSMNNNTQIECRHPLLNSEDVILTALLYEQPANISVRIMSEDLELINISWTQVSKTSLPQIFTLKISHGSANEVFVVNESFFTFQTPNNAQTCEIYNFSVTDTYIGATYTGPGCSVPSPVLSKMLPSLPSIDRLNSTLIHSLVVIDGELKLNISFEPGRFCEAYPVLSYLLEVEDSSSEVVTHSIVPQHSNLIGNLSENVEYSFKVVVANDFGIVSSSDRQFNTTDVQLVTADLNNNSDGILIQCVFIPGSDAQGCMVVLVWKSDNTTVNLTRLDTVAQRSINVTCPHIEYLKVIGYDIESDNKSIGPLAVLGRLLFNNSILCSLNDHEMESSPGITAILLTYIMIPVIVVIIIIIIVIFVLLVKGYKMRVCTLSLQPTLGCTNLQPPSQPKQDKESEELEAEELQQIMPLHELPKKSNVADKDVVEDTLNSTSKCDQNNIFMITENITTYAEITEKVADKGAVGHTHHSTSECDQNDIAMITENITTTYAEITEKDPEHFYFTLENAKKMIPPDPDAPELPPPFKSKTSPPPVYQDILDLRGNKGHSTVQNEYSTVSA